MADKFGIDHHKLNYHVGRVNDWLEKRTVYPIYIEIAPAGACNHRCSFCAVDYIGYNSVFLDKEILNNRITEMGRLGVKSIMFAGEGEPLLHKNLPEIIRHTKKTGIDVSITTNAVPMNRDWALEALSGVTWLKVSINAGSPSTYAKIHATKEKDFDKVLTNLENAVGVCNDHDWQCTLGAQMVLLPENVNEALKLAKTLKSIGCDYLVIKPYSQHKSSITRTYENIDYQLYMGLNEELKILNDDSFQVIFREKTMQKHNESEPYYKKCYSTPHFWAYVMADGSLYGCSAYLLDERFLYGNINETSFKDIWEGEKRKKNINYVLNELNIVNCRKNCRMDEVNRYLWDISNPPEHVNFI